MERSSEMIKILSVDGRKFKCEMMAKFNWTEAEWFQFYEEMKAKEIFLGLHGPVITRPAADSTPALSAEASESPTAPSRG